MTMYTKMAFWNSNFWAIRCKRYQNTTEYVKDLDC
jgi:hypothetical protein